ncbi:hypothetical protein EOM09_03310 [bacterium]|nr:hypothetical protein [bacterium]
MSKENKKNLLYLIWFSLLTIGCASLSIMSIVNPGSMGIFGSIVSYLATLGTAVTTIIAAYAIKNQKDLENIEDLSGEEKRRIIEKQDEKIAKTLHKKIVKRFSKKEEIINTSYSINESIMGLDIVQRGIILEKIYNMINSKKINQKEFYNELCTILKSINSAEKKLDESFIKSQELQEKIEE